MTRIFVVTILVLILLMTLGVAIAATRFKLAAESSTTVNCMPDAETKEKVRAIMLDAMDEALKDHILRLHETWMKDDAGQPARAVNGVRRGIAAYLGGRVAALKWNPPICPP